MITDPVSGPSRNPHADIPFSREEEARAITDLLIALGYVLDVQEEPCPYHSWRVAVLSAAMARYAAPAEISNIFYAALLHDIGAMGSFTHMVRYPTLSSQKAKFEVIAHPGRSAKTISGIPGLSGAAELAGDHHEWWNGSGFPYGKMRDGIPIGAQLIRIADTTDLSKNLRPGSEPEDAVGLARVLQDIEVGSEAVEALEKAIAEEGFYRRLRDSSLLYLMVQEIASQIPVPSEWSQPDMIDVVMLAFARTIDSKHCFTAGHSERVAGYTQRLATVMGLSVKEIQCAWYAGLLHDVGKVTVRRSIIDNVGPLDSNDFATIKRCPLASYEIIRNIAHLPELAVAALYHHEHWDGRGYPYGIRGAEIPVLSRALAVADAFDAITSPRSYKTARSAEEALRIINSASGGQFDPEIVEAANTAWKNTC